MNKIENLLNEIIESCLDENCSMGYVEKLRQEILKITDQLQRDNEFLRKDWTALTDRLKIQGVELDHLAMDDFKAHIQIQELQNKLDTDERFLKNILA